MEEPDPDCWLVVGPAAGADSQRPLNFKHQHSCCVVMGIICAEQLYRNLTPGYQIIYLILVPIITSMN